VARLALILYVLAAVAAVAAVAGVVFGPEWVEELTGFEPDAGDGSLEALLVLVPAALAVGLAGAGWIVRRRLGAEHA
jgi:hypothetical protein